MQRAEHDSTVIDNSIAFQVKKYSITVKTGMKSYILPPLLFPKHDHRIVITFL